MKFLWSHFSKYWIEKLCRAHQQVSVLTIGKDRHMEWIQVFSLRLSDPVCFSLPPTFSLISGEVLRFFSHHRVSTVSLPAESGKTQQGLTFYKTNMFSKSPPLNPCHCSFFAQTVTSDGFFSERSVEEVKRIYCAEQVVLHSPVVHLQENTWPYILFSLSGFYSRLLYGAGRFPILALENSAPICSLALLWPR